MLNPYHFVASGILFFCLWIQLGVWTIAYMSVDWVEAGLNELMESKGGKKKSSSSSSSKSLFYEAPLGYSIEDVRPNGGIKKFRSAAYSNCARKPS
ncbi:S-adenosyl-l-methionine decarboxylase leader peptide [Spatholobus suberectus]|nr:S-adenosyl-l-methionine decarboxylase leader peptide [Spatholobus suberectus]